MQPIAVGAGAAAAFGGENEGKLVLETRRGKDNVMGEGAKTTRCLAGATVGAKIYIGHTV